jgi:hypothetical protein
VHAEFGSRAPLGNPAAQHFGAMDSPCALGLPLTRVRTATSQERYELTDGRTHFDVGAEQTLFTVAYRQFAHAPQRIGPGGKAARETGGHFTRDFGERGAGTDSR